MYKEDCSKDDRSLESVFNEYEPKFDAIIQTLYEAGVNNVDNASLIEECNNDDLDDVECEEAVDCEENECYDSGVEYIPEKVIVTVHRSSRRGRRRDRRRPNRYDNCNKDCDDCN